uniref:Glycoprotein-N-acetylgalactosamine 3-beta-galactosyltransferase n=1 Tax=Tanacetum cinerariifolium TaxID=118510 RepID=A0A6L2LE21_TANCI|nr:glycoprotein-N-acetylgalactosamine 3-beta-galactosyltransferase [Tanacetum cinerariifolium]
MCELHPAGYRCATGSGSRRDQSPILDLALFTPKKFQWLPSVYHLFSLDSINKINGHEVVTNYVRMAPRGLPNCGLAGKHSADLVSRIEVLSPVTKLNHNGKTEYCDVVALMEWTLQR